MDLAGVAILVLGLLVEVGLAAVTIGWIRRTWLPRRVLMVGLSVGLVGVALFVPMMIARDGLATAALMGVPMAGMMWAGVEQHRAAGGQSVWALPLLERVARWLWLRKPGHLDRCLRPDNGPFLTLDQIRAEYARQVLADATVDPNLDELLVDLAAQTLALVRERERSACLVPADDDRSEKLLRRRTVLLGFANALLDAASEPDPLPPRSRTYRGYSATTLHLAAVCRLADDRRLLAT